MPKAKSPSPRRVRRSTQRKIQANDVWARTQLLVEILMAAMEQELQSEQAERSERWLKYFGPRDSALVNLQKLVDLLAELQSNAGKQASFNEQGIATVGPEELAMLEDWMRYGGASAANASPAAGPAACAAATEDHGSAHS